MLPPVNGRPRTIAPILPVTSVEETLAWYEAYLGASDRWVWGEPVDLGGCMLGAAPVQFTLSPKLAAAMKGFELFITVNDVATYYGQVKGSGASIGAHLERQPWGASQFIVEDPNGVQLRFCEFGGATTSGEPLTVQLEARQLTPAENKKLKVAVGWAQPDSDKDGSRHPTLYTVVAVHEGEVVGAASVTGNGTDTFQVRDVMVLPAYQGKSIGTQMMREVLAWVKQEVPKGELVTLQTGTATTKFYESFGFLGSDSGWVGMYIKV